jgi:hypothetical protein
MRQFSNQSVKHLLENAVAAPSKNGPNILGGGAGVSGP